MVNARVFITPIKKVTTVIVETLFATWIWMDGDEHVWMNGDFADWME